MEINKLENYKQVTEKFSTKNKIRNFTRDKLISCLSSFKKVKNKNDITFPFYHHIFNDEIKGFKKQLTYLKNYGEFINYDNAIDLLKKNKIDGKYFVVSFDDGFKNCITNALEVLNEENIMSMFFLTTGFIDKNNTNVGTFFSDNNLNIDFLSWDDCKTLINNKMDIGSHSINHFRSSLLTEDQLLIEMKNSKNTIEDKLEIECKHYASPFGDFVPNRDQSILKRVGYQSFSTAFRGSNNSSEDIFLIKRDHILANWDVDQLKFFLI